MKRNIILSSFLILLSFAFCSCSKAFDVDTSAKEGSVHILGAVIDNEDGRPLEGIKITFYYSDFGVEVKHSAYTSSDGSYIIKADGVAGYIRGAVIAQDENGLYKASDVRVVNVTWQSESYDEKRNIFYINDIDFQLFK